MTYLKYNISKIPKFFIKFRKAISFILATTVTIILSYYINDYLNKSEIHLDVKYVKISTDKHIYLIEISNFGNTNISNISFDVNVQNNQIISSLFDNRMTTHDIIKQEKLYQLSGKKLVNNEKYLCMNISDQEKITNTELYSKKNYISFDNISKFYWYKVSYDPFSLIINEKKHSYILLNSPVSKKDFRCKYKNIVVHTKRIECLPSTWFKNVSTLLSFQNKTDTSRIYVEGFGTANEFNYEHSKIVARDRAIKDMYGMIIDNLYGIRVEKVSKDFISESGYRSITPQNKSFVTSTIVVSSHGVIDKKSLIIFNEDFKKLYDGSLCCSLKGYYELPWMTNKLKFLINFRDIVSNIDLKNQVAIEREGEKGKYPEWLSNPLSDSDVIYGIGHCTVKKIPKEIAKRIAMYRSIGDIADDLNTKIYSRFKTLTDKSGNPQLYESISKHITDIFMKKVKVVEYYSTPDDNLFVLSKLNLDSEDTFFINQNSSQNKKKNTLKKKTLYNDLEADQNFEKFKKALDSLNFSD